MTFGIVPHSADVSARLRRHCTGCMEVQSFKPVVAHVSDSPRQEERRG